MCLTVAQKMCHCACAAIGAAARPIKIYCKQRETGLLGRAVGGLCCVEEVTSTFFLKKNDYGSPECSSE